MMQNEWLGLLGAGVSALALAGAACAATTPHTNKVVSRPSGAVLGLRVAQEGAPGAFLQAVRGSPGAPLPLNVVVPDKAGDYRFVLVRGLPSGATLTRGFGIRQSWFVAARDVPQVRLVVAPNVRGNFRLEIFFFRQSGEEPIGRILVPVLMDGLGPGDKTDRAPTASNPGSVSGSEKQPSILLSPAQETAMLARAEGLLREGDVASARLLYEELAARGSAKGALAMGQSWDPNFMKNIFVAGGLKPDPEVARVWYKRSLDMGNTDAESRLSRLSAN